MQCNATIQNGWKLFFFSMNTKKNASRITVLYAVATFNIWSILFNNFLITFFNKFHITMSTVSSRRIILIPYIIFMYTQWLVYWSVTIQMNPYNTYWEYQKISFYFYSKIPKKLYWIFHWNRPLIHRIFLHTMLKLCQAKYCMLCVCFFLVNRLRQSVHFVYFTW